MKKTIIWYMLIYITTRTYFMKTANMNAIPNAHNTYKADWNITNFQQIYKLKY